MNCKHCGTALAEGEVFCANCGAAVEQPAVEQPAPAPVQTYAPVPPAAPQPVTRPFMETDLPSQYRPLGPWSYFGLQILYSIPVVGFIFLIIFSFKSDNINRRNFTRSYWCALLIGVIIGIVIAVIMAVAGVGLFTATKEAAPAMPYPYY